MPPRSKIARLPADIRRDFERMVVEHQYGDIHEVTAWLNGVLARAGIDETVGKSAVGLASKRIQRAQESIRATTEATRLIAEASRDDADTRSEAAIALVQSQVFELLLELREAVDEESDPVERMKVLTKVAKSLSEMSRARVNQAKWRSDVEAKLKAAADKVSKLAKKGGMDAKTVAEIRASILGIVKREPQQEQA